MEFDELLRQLHVLRDYGQVLGRRPGPEQVGVQQERVAGLVGRILDVEGDRLRAALGELSVPSTYIANVTLFEGHARFTGPRTIDTGTGETITADQVVVATGSRPTVPDVPGLADVPFHTSDTVMRIDDLPASALEVRFDRVHDDIAAHPTR